MRIRIRIRMYPDYHRKSKTILKSMTIFRKPPKPMPIFWEKPKSMPP